MASYLRRLGLEAVAQKTSVCFLLFSNQLDGYETLKNSKITVRKTDNREPTGAIPSVPNVKASDAKNVLVAMCVHDRQPVGDTPPVFDVFVSNNAANAIKFAETQSVHKIAALGYGLFAAGLTMQTVVYPRATDLKLLRTKKDGLKAANESQRLKLYVPTFMTLAVSERGQGLDTSLQMVGRCFAELKRGGSDEGVLTTRHILKPHQLTIQLLSVDGMVARLVQYVFLSEPFHFLKIPLPFLESARLWNLTQVESF